MLINIEPEVNDSDVIQEENDKAAYVQVLKALRDMLQASLLRRKDLGKIYFIIYLYDPCVASSSKV